MTNPQILNSFTDRGFYDRIPKKEFYHSPEALPKQADLTKSYIFWNLVKGVGKTKRATHFLRDWLTTNNPTGFDISNYKDEPAWIDMVDLQANILLKNNFNTSKDAIWVSGRIIEEVKTAKLLILDDFEFCTSTDRDKESVNSVLYDIFNYRYNHNLQTIITTNLDLVQIYEQTKNNSGLISKYLSRMLGLCIPSKVKGEVDLRGANLAIQKSEEF
jgi:hypothetical protein